MRGRKRYFGFVRATLNDLEREVDADSSDHYTVLFAQGLYLVDRPKDYVWILAELESRMVELADWFDLRPGEAREDINRFQAEWSEANQK